MAANALGARARLSGHAIHVEVARVVDRDSAESREASEVIEAADLVYLPGGDPDIVPGLLGPTAAGRALAAASRRGA